MTQKEQIKILDNKIKGNNAQYDLDRMNAEISTCSSGDLPKYEYLTKKDLGYKPDAFEQAKFEYSPLGKVFTDGLDIKNGIKIYKKRPRTDKNKSIINNSNKVIKGIELFKSMIDNDEFKIPGEYYAKPNNNINLDWMNDKIGYEETTEEADSVYMKKNNGNELKLIEDFITKINNGFINNKNKAGNEFRKLKQKVTNNRLKQDLIKDLERYIFGEDLDSFEPEEKYEESIAERIKTRK